jgi:hypothetical protein
MEFKGNQEYPLGFIIISSQTFKTFELLNKFVSDSELSIVFFLLLDSKTSRILSTFTGSLENLENL